MEARTLGGSRARRCGTRGSGRNAAEADRSARPCRRSAPPVRGRPRSTVARQRAFAALRPRARAAPPPSAPATAPENSRRNSPARHPPAPAPGRGRRRAGAGSPSGTPSRVRRIQLIIGGVRSRQRTAQVGVAQRRLQSSSTAFSRARSDDDTPSNLAEVGLAATVVPVDVLEKHGRCARRPSA